MVESPAEAPSRPPTIRWWFRGLVGDFVGGLAGGPVGD